MENTVAPLDMIKILPQAEYSAARRFIDIGEELDCKAQTRYAKSNKYWRCVFYKKKPKRVLFTVECTEEWWRVKAMLLNLEEYKDQLVNCSESLVGMIKSAYECHKCNNFCKGPNPFVLEGKEYKKCLGCSFYFKNLPESDWDSLIELLKNEALL